MDKKISRFRCELVKAQAAGANQAAVGRFNRSQCGEESGAYGYRRAGVEEAKLAELASGP